MSYFEQQADYRKLWLSEHCLPAPCFFCGADVVVWGTRKGAAGGGIHHVDHDRTNNSLENLVPAHHSCHLSHHKLGVPKSELHRQRIAASCRGRTLSSETRAKIGAATRGVSRRPWTSEERAAQVAKSECPDCGKEYNPVWMTRHRNEGKCVPRS